MGTNGSTLSSSNLLPVKKFQQLFDQEVQINICFDAEQHKRDQKALNSRNENFRICCPLVENFTSSISENNRLVKLALYQKAPHGMLNNFNLFSQHTMVKSWRVDSQPVRGINYARYFPPCLITKLRGAWWLSG